MLRVGIIAEGKSEWLVLEAIMRKLHGEIEFVRLRPDLTLASMSPHGWKGVRAWCQEMGSSLRAFMEGVKGQELHLLVIHADCSMAHNEQADRPCPPASGTADALRQVISEHWLGQPEQPPFIVLATPSKSTDAWVVATLEPLYEKLESIECAWEVENVLVARKLLRKKGKEVKKPESQYRPLAAQVADRLDDVRSRCTQAARFIEEFQAAASFVMLAAPP